MKNKIKNKKIQINTYLRYKNLKIIIIFLNTFVTKKYIIYIFNKFISLRPSASQAKSFLNVKNKCQGHVGFFFWLCY
jgi:hypothetical protein